MIDMTTVYNWFILTTGILSLLIGILLISGFNLLKNINKVCNKWFNTVEKIVQILNSVPMTLDDWVMIKRKIVGIALILISLVFIINGSAGFLKK